MEIPRDEKKWFLTSWQKSMYPSSIQHRTRLVIDRCIHPSSNTRQDKTRQDYSIQYNTLTMTPEEQADDFRQRGNHEFQKGHLENAISLYSAALEVLQQSPPHASLSLTSHIITNLCNRSACYYQLEDYETALQDASEAWTMSQQSNVKASYRLSKTHLALGQPSEALGVLQTALTLTNLDDTQRSSLETLQQEAHTKLVEASSSAPVEELSIQHVNRPISIREFVRGQQLGVGNFSEIVVVTHKTTQENFALKILEKKQAAELAKRQHPNVYNEIAMERRVLLERLPPHPNIITMYHAFADFNNLYYLMELHNINTDLWSCLRYSSANSQNNGTGTGSIKMVGTHPSCIRRWMYQLVNALEFIHSHGIVHRDLKPENIMLNARNHVVVLDFGTAKDLCQTDLNGPEFVGTPDFMSPEAVRGGSQQPPKDSDTPTTTTTTTGADHTADLWALGAMVYILYTGTCPFWSPSPYLTFLRISRGLLPRNAWAMPEEEEDAAWDFCSRLMAVRPSERLGADCFAVDTTTTTHDNNKVIAHPEGYHVLRNHAFFQKIDPKEEDNLLHVIPSLQDLALRACATLVQQDARDLDICDAHPPGDKSSHDMLRLTPSQRKKIWHVLDKLKVFSGGKDETRVWQRFFATDVEALQAKVRPTSRDFWGLTRMNDDEFKLQSQRGSEDPYAVKEDPDPTKVVILRNPGLCRRAADGELPSPEQEKNWLKGWKNSIAHINKVRPKVVVAVGAQTFPPKYWKFLARIRDSIPVVWNDGSVYYTFWLNGFQGIVLQSSGFINDTESLQMKWLQEEMEQSRMAKHPVFCFVDGDPRYDLPQIVLKRLARGKVQCLYGIAATDEASPASIDYTITYSPNETVDDGASVKSTDSQEDEEDTHTMRVIVGTPKTNGVEWLTVDEKDPWWTSFEAIDMPQ